jgi:chromosome partitioning protein
VAIYFKELIDEQGNLRFHHTDSPPLLDLLTINSFTAADEIIIPLKRNFLKAQGLASWSRENQKAD